MTFNNKFRSEYLKHVYDLQDEEYRAKNPQLAEFHFWRHKFLYDRVNSEDIEKLRKLPWKVRMIQMGFGFRVTAKVDDLISDHKKLREETGEWYFLFSQLENDYPDIFTNPETQLSYFKRRLLYAHEEAFEFLYLHSKKKYTGPICDRLYDAADHWNDEENMEYCNFMDLEAYDNFKSKWY